VKKVEAAKVRLSASVPLLAVQSGAEYTTAAAPRRVNPARGAFELWLYGGLR
jgi:hypothetical protein